MVAESGSGPPLLELLHKVGTTNHQCKHVGEVIAKSDYKQPPSVLLIATFGHSQVDDHGSDSRGTAHIQKYQSDTKPKDKNIFHT